MNPSKRPEIAADDWGFSKGINEGILDLARNGIVRVVSLIANAPHLEHGFSELKKISDVKFAWHMNFTAGKPIEAAGNSFLVRTKTQNFHSLKGFMWHWWRGNITPSELTHEARAQIKILKNLAGDISEADGHHHVHLVPGVLEALAPLYREFSIPSIRLPMEKTHLPSFLGSQLVWRQKAKYPNLNLRLYGYPQPRHFANSQTFLKASSHGRPVLVHPAAFDDFQGNPYGDKLCAERVRQYEALRQWFL